MRTANTPAFSSGRAVREAQSPAAKISGSVSVCKVSRTQMNPWSSSARPVSRSQAAPPAWVTQRISSASITAPARVRNCPAATSATSASRCTVMPRSARTLAKAARTVAL